MLVILSLLLAVTIVATFWSAVHGKLSETIIGVVFIIIIGAMFGVYFYEQQERKINHKEMKIEIEVNYCSECPFGKVLADPDPYDWFCDDDEKVVCTKLNKKVAGALRPYEVGKIDNVPNWCPFDTKKEENQ